MHSELRQCLASKREKSARALLNTYILLVGSWAEVRLCKLLNEPNGFADKDRSAILAKDKQLDRWLLTLELGFRRRYGVKSAKLTKSSLSSSAHANYRELSALIEDDLRPIIEVRNRLAHGQWARMLNSKTTDYAPDLMALLANENALSAKFKLRMLDCMSQLVHNLVAGSAAFERDFDKHYRVLHQAKTNLDTRSYEAWKMALQAKLARGRKSARDGT